MFTGVGGLGNDTLLEALSYEGDKGVAGARQILLRTAVAALLNASFHETMLHDDYLYYPYTVADVIAEVNAALSSNNRSVMLSLADDFDGVNNGNHYFDWSWTVPVPPVP